MTDITQSPYRSCEKKNAITQSLFTWECFYKYRWGSAVGVILSRSCPSPVCCTVFFSLFVLFPICVCVLLTQTCLSLHTCPSSGPCSALSVSPAYQPLPAPPHFTSPIFVTTMLYLSSFLTWILYLFREGRLRASSLFQWRPEYKIYEYTYAIWS